MTRWRSLLPYVALTAAIAVAYWEVRLNDFVAFDDDSYVSENPVVREGLTPSSIAYAFTTSEGGSWEPLSWLSHMLVCQLFGLHVGVHHAVNVLLHTANAWLLFAILRRMTGRTWPSVLAAALFGLHPLHVESVAWLSERKDVLSTLFLLLAIGAYQGYVEHPAAGRLARTGALLGLGLMAKPMPMTLPLLLLLLDFWPLGRIRLRGRRTEWPVRVLLEKVPLLALCAAIAVVSVWFQHREGFVADFEAVSLRDRLGNALVSYVRYLGKLVWPADLAMFYPLKAWPLWQISGAALLLVAVSGLCILWARRFPYLLVGWSWYLVALIPVIGVVQLGGQAMADRYAYVPSIGLYIAAAWSVGDLVKRWPATRAVVAVATIALLAACVHQTRNQVRVWKDSITLFGHAASVIPDNCFAQHGLGYNLARQGRHEEAIVNLRESMRVCPTFLDPRFALAELFHQRGQEEETIRELRSIVAIGPASIDGHYQLGLALARVGRFKLAAAQFEELLVDAPDHVSARYNLAIALLRRGEVAPAARHLGLVIEQRPDAAAHYALGLALAASGAPEDAVMHFREAVRLAPDEARYQLNLARALERQARSEASRGLPE